MAFAFLSWASCSPALAARSFASLLTLGILAVGVGGCSTSPGASSAFASLGAAPPEKSGIVANPTLTVVTTRNAVNGVRSRPWFGTQRANQPSNVRIHLSTPGDGAFGAVGIGDWSIKSVEIIPVGESFSEGPMRRDVLIYVHGFNQSFETAALDAARLSDGLGFRGDTMLFSWPSRNSLVHYIYDRESAMWSRDALEGMLDELITDPSVGTIHIVAHSMGTMPTVEALRQLYDRRGASMTGRFGAIVLASPDMDMDNFTSSISRIRSLARKIAVLTVPKDRALATMRDMAGGAPRVGLAERPQLEALSLRVIDASADFDAGGLNHDLFLSNAQARQAIRRVIGEASPGAVAATH